MRKTLFFLTLLTAPFIAHAELYKWVDANGKVHYSDQPPAEVVNAKVIGNGKGKTVAAPATDAKKDAPKATPKSAADREMEFNKRRQEAKESAAKKEKEAAEAKEKQENCTQARTTLRSLQEGTRVSTTNEKGERVVLDDVARQREIERAQKSVDSWCK